MLSHKSIDTNTSLKFCFFFILLLLPFLSKSNEKSQIEIWKTLNTKSKVKHEQCCIETKFLF